MGAFVNMLREIVAFEPVLRQLVRQYLVLRYRRTVLGYFWTLANPLLMMTTTAFVFANLFKAELSTFIVFMFAGMVAWNCFSSVVTHSAASFLLNEGLIRKIYLPKILFPLSVSLGVLIDSMLSLLALFVIMFCIGGEPSLALFFLPVAYLLLFVFAFGVALFIAVLTVFFRDLQYMITILLQALFFLSPVIYDKSSMTGKLSWLLDLNPLTFFIELFRAPIRYGVLPSGHTVVVSLILAVISFVVGCAFFLAQEKKLVFRL